MSEFLKEADVAKLLPKRDDNGNKGSFGTLLSVCGSEFMTGAAFFSSSAALKTGIGLLKLASPRSALKPLQSALFEPVFAPLSEKNGFISKKSAKEILNYSSKASALLIGCGLGLTSDVKAAVCSVLSTVKLPTVVDADALNAVSETGFNFNNPNTVITPHPLEFSRLTALSVEEIQENRIKTALNYSVKQNVITVLKGAYTVIAAPDGKVAVSPFTTSSLSKGGSGDVLAGLIAGFLAGGVSPFDSACLGVYIHGLSAKMLCENMPARSVLPSDVVNFVPNAVIFLEKQL